jgi:hypothetical protein
MKKKSVKKAVVKKPTKRRRVDKTPKEGEYMGIPYESFCELSCIFFAEELIKAGYATSITRPPSYSLCDPIQHSYAVQLKRGSKQETQTISLGVTYTPDFTIHFTEKAVGKFIWVLGSNVKYEKHLLVAQPVATGGYFCIVEVKPDFSRNSTTPKSVQSMKWLYQRHGWFINLFRPNRVFEGLFVPEKYRLTERGTPRLLKFKARNLQEYLKLKQ